MDTIDRISTWMFALILIVALVFFYPGPW